MLAPGVLCQSKAAMENAKKTDGHMCMIVYAYLYNIHTHIDVCVCARNVYV